MTKSSRLWAITSQLAIEAWTKKLWATLPPPERHVESPQMAHVYAYKLNMKTCSPEVSCKPEGLFEQSSPLSVFRSVNDCEVGHGQRWIHFDKNIRDISMNEALPLDFGDE